MIPLIPPQKLIAADLLSLSSEVCHPRARQRLERESGHFGARAFASSTISAKLKSETAELRRAAGETKKAAYTSGAHETQIKAVFADSVAFTASAESTCTQHSAPFQIVRTIIESLAICSSSLGSARCVGKCDVVWRLIASTAASEFGTCTLRHYNYQQYAQSHIVFIIRYIRRYFIFCPAALSLHRRRRADASAVE